jgi:uncharacterized membrane protein
MASHEHEPSVDTGAPLDDERRKFLAACGKFAVVTPPAVTLLLSTSLNSKAIAQSGGRGGQDHGRGGSGGSSDGGGDGGHPGGADLLDWLEKLLEKLL